MRNTIVFFLLLVNLQLFSCAQWSARSGYYSIRDIPESNGDERLRRFSEFPVERQIDIYLYSESLVDTVTPPIEYYLSIDGEKKIPAILSRIDALPDDDSRPKLALIIVVNHIDSRCDCLTTDGLEMLRRNCAEMRDMGRQELKRFTDLYGNELKEIEVRHEPNN